MRGIGRILIEHYIRVDDVVGKLEQSLVVTINIRVKLLKKQIVLKKILSEPLH